MKATREEAERNKRALQQLLRLSHNKECADCTAKGPTWCAINWGVFICITCAGIHRKMGVHISKVKSCTLDDWITKDVELVKRVQNNLQKKLYEHSLPPNRRKPNEHSDIGEIERFIREKYEKRTWMCKGAEEGAAGIPAGGISHAESHSNSMSSASTPSSEDSFVNDSSFSNLSPASASENFSNGDGATLSNHRQRQRLANSANNSFRSSTSSQITTASDGFDRFSAPPRRQPPRSQQQQQRTQQPLKSSSDDLLFFDTSDQNNNSDTPLESLISANHGFSTTIESNNNNNNNNGSLASNMDASSSLSATFVSNGNTESKGSKDDILRLFDEPQHQQMHYGSFQQGIHGTHDQTSMTMNGGQMYMMNAHYGASMQSMNSHGYGPQVSMYGGVSMMHINGQYQYGSGMQYGNGAGGHPMMYNSAGGFATEMLQQQQQQQQHHQQQYHHHHHHHQ